jgi:hypothetical protein
MNNSSWAIASLAFGALLMATDASAEEQKRPPPASVVTIPSVTSTDQHNGATVGYVNQFNQTVLPSLVRGPQLEKLKAIFTEGAQIKRAFGDPMTDDKVDQLTVATDHWIDSAFQWLRLNVSQYAAERFLFRQPQLGVFYNLPGVTKTGYADKWGNYQKALSDFLVNLDQLMRDPSIYPEHDK